MKFYDCKTAPSPRRARIFIAEKGIELETVEVDLRNEEQLGDAFKAINPRCTVPVLLLDDGTALTENIGIAAYLEAFKPDPPLMGTTATEKGLIATWNARVELEGLWPVADAFRNRSKGLKGRAIVGPTNYAQIPELAERGRARVGEFFAMLDQRLRHSAHIAGDDFSLADITALCVVDFAAWAKLVPSGDQTHLADWLARMKARPSAAL